MTRRERSLFRLTALIGAALTLTVVALDLAGALGTLERSLYDQRAAHFQYSQPEPTDRIVHVDIDDGAINALGRWPWDRTEVARIIDEIRLAGASTLFLDVVFSEPQDKRPDAGVTAAAAAAASGPPAGPPEHDRALAESLLRFRGPPSPGNPRGLRALVPISARFDGPRSDVAIAVREEIKRANDLTVTAEQVAQKLLPVFRRPGVIADVENEFLPARQYAAFELIDNRPEFATMPLPELRRALLKGIPETVSAELHMELLRRQQDRVLAVRRLRDFTREPDPALPPLLSADDEEAPIARLCEAAGYSGFVDYLPLNDGVVRSVPLWISHRGRLFPQAAFALACAELGVDAADPRQVGVEPGRVVIRPPGKDPIVIPVHEETTTAHGARGMFMYVPWFGGRDWKSMYGLDEADHPRRHVSAGYVWVAARDRESLARNNLTADDALANLLTFSLINKQAEARRLKTEPPPAADWAVRRGLVETTLAEFKDFHAAYKSMDAAALSDEDRTYVRSYDDLANILRENDEITARLDKSSAHLRHELAGRAVIFGATASAATDFVKTSLHPQCPGPAVHGVVFNGILTGELWSQMPRWFTVAATALIGLLVAAASSRPAPWASLAAAAGLALGYAAFNAVVLFDYGNRVAGLAGPLVAAGVVWGGCSTFRFVSEFAERRRITQRFRSYVDPTLVDYVIENPQDRLNGQVAELTVAFTDLAGFTTLSERLREEAVPLLSDYLSLMVPIIRQHKGYVNKFLGDGIMFFFGAPRSNPNHAVGAVAALLQMREALETFNQDLARRGLPPLRVRAGINTGQMVVGDTGPPDAADYTVIGDEVNLASRLESANKALGTFILIGGRTAELLGGKYLLRPVGRIKVVGREQLVTAYEPLVEAEDATGEQKRAVEQTGRMINLFQQGRFAECLEVTDALRDVGPGKLLTLYRGMCERYLVEPPADFRGHLELTEK